MVNRFWKMPCLVLFELTNWRYMRFNHMRKKISKWFSICKIVTFQNFDVRNLSQNASRTCMLKWKSTEKSDLLQNWNNEKFLPQNDKKLSLNEVFRWMYFCVTYKEIPTTCFKTWQGTVKPYFEVQFWTCITTSQNTAQKGCSCHAFWRTIMRYNYETFYGVF